MIAASPQRHGPFGWLSRRSRMFWLVAAGCAVVASGPAYILWSFGAFIPPDVILIPFESAAWQTAAPIGKRRTVRSQMVDDLVRRRLLDGLSRGEVEQLLGPPLPDVKRAGADASRWQMVYSVGLERAGRWSLDDELLVIRFDEQGRVSECATAVN